MTHLENSTVPSHHTSINDRKFVTGFQAGLKILSDMIFYAMICWVQTLFQRLQFKR